MADNTELLPCPFCGRKHDGIDAVQEGSLHWYVLCDCGVSSGHFPTEAEARQNWNTRPTYTGPNAELIERLRELAQAMQGDMDAARVAFELGNSRPRPTISLGRGKVCGWLPAIWKGINALAAADAEVARSNAMRKSVHEELDKGSGFWRSCSGCQESCDGYVSTNDYPYSETFRCQPGSGCRECGGIGVVWDDTDYEAYARAALKGA